MRRRTRGRLFLLVALVSAFTAVLWHQSGKVRGVGLVHTLPASGYVTSIAWSPDGQTLATISDFGQFTTIWGADGTRRRELGPVMGSYVDKSIGFLEDGRHLLTPSKGDILRKNWPTIGELLRENRQPREDLIQDRPLPAEDLLLESQTAVSVFTVRDLATGAVVNHVWGPAQDKGGAFSSLRHYAVSPNGAMVALATNQGKLVYVYDSRTWRILRTLRPRGHSSGFSLVFSPDSRRLIIGQAAAVMICDINHPEWKEEWLQVYDDSSGKPGVVSQAFSPDGSMLATGAYIALQGDSVPNNEFIRIWRLSDHALLASLGREGDFGPGGGSVKALSWSADGRSLAAAMGKEVRIYAPLEPQAPPRILKFSNFVMTLAFAPDRPRLAVPDGAAVKIFNISP